ncbi:MAG TPA: GAF domain-containing protein, partial [Myxococcaceae bacterium]|nr:GAF domain-containing protein [Myxococcaceae bacterium]
QVTPMHEARTLAEMPVVTALPTRPQSSSGEKRPPSVAAAIDRTAAARPRASSPNLQVQVPDSTVVQRRPASRALQIEPASVVELEQPVRPVGAIGRPQRKRNTREDIENVLAEVFERVQSVNAKKSVNEALYFLLDLALEKIPAESGTLFRADPATGDLFFSAVRGPKAQELLRANLVIPAGTGIVGFCVHEGVTVALSDVQKDPRYYAAVAARVNYETRSVLATPLMTQGRTFGCLQLINKQGTPLFSEVEVGLAAYIAHQAALYLASRD